MLITCIILVPSQESTYFLSPLLPLLTTSTPGLITPALAADAVYDLRHELARQTSIPFLVIVDEMNALYWPSAFTTEEGPVHPSKLLLSAAFRCFDDMPDFKDRKTQVAPLPVAELVPRRGGILAAVSHSVSPRNGEEKPHRGLELRKGFLPNTLIKVSPYSKQEFETAVSYYFKKDLVVTLFQRELDLLNTNHKNFSPMVDLHMFRYAEAKGGLFSPDRADRSDRDLRKKEVEEARDEEEPLEKSQKRVDQSMQLVHSTAQRVMVPCRNQMALLEMLSGRVPGLVLNKLLLGDYGTQRVEVAGEAANTEEKWAQYADTRVEAQFGELDRYERARHEMSLIKNPGETDPEKKMMDPRDLVVPEGEEVVMDEDYDPTGGAFKEKKQSGNVENYYTDPDVPDPVNHRR